MPFDDAVAAARAYHPRSRADPAARTPPRAAIDAAIADFYPELTLQASFSWAGSISPMNYFAFLGPALNWVVFSGWDKTAAPRRRRLAPRGLREPRPGEQLIFLDLRQAYAALEDTARA
jgi:outer membrane protein TolC